MPGGGDGAAPGGDARQQCQGRRAVVTPQPGQERVVTLPDERGRARRAHGEAAGHLRRGALGARRSPREPQRQPGGEQRDQGAHTGGERHRCAARELPHCGEARQDRRCDH